ncbi:CsbD family protein [Streptococcus ictaluri]|uniref:CsbD-like protein n=1 Tax=Streptococcus ictaluri 707-05 TaxID=764299 RepID=G5K3I2_9STRE|nr:CsbD family protein [Streptococcus ictaluri]EHI69608.1 CsbD-like protein [Streptococcus ictaluri 707-05]
MSEEKLKAKLAQVKGGLKEGAGKVSGDKELEAKGFMEKTLAKGKELAEEAKEAVEDAFDHVKDKMK